MPFTAQDIAQAARQNNQKEPGNYAAPEQNLDRQVEDMPNASKLTRSERAIYKALPGVSNTFGAFSDKLDKFDSSPQPPASARWSSTSPS